MNFETGENQEKQPVRMTQEQFDRISSTFGDDMKSEAFLTELQELGIELNSGDIEIVVDGERKKMVTASNDFGTVVVEN